VKEKPLFWMGSSKRDLMGFPEDVKDEAGYALHLAQNGEHSIDAKRMQGIGRGVFEIVSNYDGDTYRSVYTIQFREAVYVLHAFQKKSKTGIKTPREDVNLISVRLKAAEDDRKQRFQSRGKVKKGSRHGKKKARAKRGSRS
jgi:phage-related protein